MTLQKQKKVLTTDRSIFLCLFLFLIAKFILNYLPSATKVFWLFWLLIFVLIQTSSTFLNTIATIGLFMQRVSGSILHPACKGKQIVGSRNRRWEGTKRSELLTWYVLVLWLGLLTLEWGLNFETWNCSSTFRLEIEMCNRNYIWKENFCSNTNSCLMATKSNINSSSQLCPKWCGPFSELNSAIAVEEFLPFKSLVQIKFWNSTHLWEELFLSRTDIGRY